MADSYDKAEFARLQSRLADMWPAMGLHSAVPRRIVVISSITVDLPDHVYAVIPAYEERYLFFVLLAARSTQSHVIYVTSQPIPERVVNYYLNLIPGVSAEEIRGRISLVSVVDSSPRPLVRKILERPRLLERLRNLIGEPRIGVLLPFVATEEEAQLALRLGIPLYGPDPDLKALGTKTGSRQLFAAAGVPAPRGTSGIRDRDDLVAALVVLQRSAPVGEAIVKLDWLGGGLGNASVTLDGVTDPAEIGRRVDRLEPEDDSLTPDAYLGLLHEGAVVEERLTGADLRSPSVQLRISPMGDSEVLSTHDQLLGGPGGQTFLGCTFPADAAYRQLIATHARAVSGELARRGVVGRFAVDFVVRRTATGGWDAYAIEINLRNGGTTHPTLTMLAMTAGRYDEDTGEYVAEDAAKHYVASDHLEHPSYRTLTPDDALDVLSQPALAWDPERLVGPVFHMTSAVAIAGRLGITAIGNSPSEARACYEAAQAALDDAAEIPTEQRIPPPWRGAAEAAYPAPFS